MVVSFCPILYIKCMSCFVLVIFDQIQLSPHEQSQKLNLQWQFHQLQQLNDLIRWVIFTCSLQPKLLNRPKNYDSNNRDVGNSIINIINIDNTSTQKFRQKINILCRWQMTQISDRESFPGKTIDFSFLFLILTSFFRTPQVKWYGLKTNIFVL